jgi:hypothetical protein
VMEIVVLLILTACQKLVSLALAHLATMLELILSVMDKHVLLTLCV